MVFQDTDTRTALYQLHTKVWSLSQSVLSTVNQSHRWPICSGSLMRPLDLQPSSTLSYLPPCATISARAKAKRHSMHQYSPHSANIPNPFSRLNSKISKLMQYCLSSGLFTRSVSIRLYEIILISATAPFRSPPCSQYVPLQQYFHNSLIAVV